MTIILKERKLECKLFFFFKKAVGLATIILLCDVMLLSFFDFISLLLFFPKKRLPRSLAATNLAPKFRVFELQEEENDIHRMRVHPSKTVLMRMGFVHTYYCFLMAFI